MATSLQDTKDSSVPAQESPPRSSGRFGVLPPPKAGSGPRCRKGMKWVKLKLPYIVGYSRVLFVNKWILSVSKLFTTHLDMDLRVVCIFFRGSFLAIRSLKDHPWLCEGSVSQG